MRERGVLTLPKSIRDSIGLGDDAILNVHIENNTVVLTPYHGENALLEEIRRGLEQIRQGDFIEFGSIEELHHKAKSYVDAH